MIVQNSYKLAKTHRHVVGMSCGFILISQNLYKYSINSYRIARVYLYFVMNIVDMSYGTRRTFLTKTLVTQLVDICGDMWRVITCANSSHIRGKLVTVGQGLKVRTDKYVPRVTVWDHSAEPRDAKTVTLGTDLSVRTSHSSQILIFSVHVAEQAGFSLI